MSLHYKMALAVTLYGSKISSKPLKLNVFLHLILHRLEWQYITLYLYLCNLLRCPTRVHNAAFKPFDAFTIYCPAFSQSPNLLSTALYFPEFGDWIPECCHAVS